MMQNAQKEILRFDHVSKAFFGVYAVKDVSFSTYAGEVLAIIGENGAGKSTMMNMIGGVLKPNGGQMFYKGQPYAPQDPIDATKHGVSFIHQELNLFNNLSIMDNMFISGFKKIPGTPLIDKRTLRKRTRDILEMVDLHVSPDMPVEKLSPGERQLVEIAKELSRNPELIIFDEPTTSLTARETEKLFSIIERIRDDGKSIIYISHILDDVRRLSDRILVLRDGNVTDTGDTADFTPERMIHSMVGRDITHLYPETRPEARGDVLLDVKHLTQRGIVKDINFQVRAGEIVGMFGLMGSGRSETARMIFGLDEYDSGEVTFKGKPHPHNDPVTSIRNGFAFVTENRREEGLLMEFSVYDNIGIVSQRNYCKKLGMIDQKAIEAPIRASVKDLSIKSGDIRKQQVKGLSGGNQQKVVIAKWLMSKPSLLIIDEPTRGIDVGAKADIYNLLNSIAADGAGILAISSEIEELIGICNRIIIMSQGEIVGEVSSDEFDREKIMAIAFRQNMGGAGQ